MRKSYNVLICYIFTTAKTLNFSGACYQEWNNLVARRMVAKRKCRLAINNIFTTLMMSLLTAKYWSLQPRLGSVHQYADVTPKFH